MLAKLQITLENTTDKAMNYNMASLFQGMLMELLGEETGEWLHRQQRHPYSQYIQYEKNVIEWTISTLTEEAFKRVIEPLLSDSLQEFYCEYHQITFMITNRSLTAFNEQEFLEQNYFNDFSRSFTIDFLTPTSFKSNGQYMNYPTVRWIFQSLMHKYDCSGIGNQIYDEETLQMIEEQVSVSQYKLRSTVFRLEGIRIPAFVGQVKIYAKSNQSIVNLVNYLLKYGEYSGVGIKSAIGMGAIRVQNSERKNV